MKSIDTENFIKIIQASERFQFEFNELFKLFGLTHQQYNVLRILNGAGEQGLPTREIANRMINRLPDITRLIDRLKDKGFLKRRRLTRDRRIVRITITEDGKELLANLRNIVDKHHVKQFSRLAEDQKETLLKLLSELVGVDEETK